MNTSDYVICNSIFTGIHEIPKVSCIPQYLDDKVLSVCPRILVLFPQAVSSSAQPLLQVSKVALHST